MNNNFRHKHHSLMNIFYAIFHFVNSRNDNYNALDLSQYQCSFFFYLSSSVVYNNIEFIESMIPNLMFDEKYSFFISFRLLKRDDMSIENVFRLRFRNMIYNTILNIFFLDLFHSNFSSKHYSTNNKQTIKHLSLHSEKNSSPADSFKWVNKQNRTSNDNDWHMQRIFTSLNRHLLL